MTAGPTIDHAAILRLGLAPMLLLGWNVWMGDVLPFLGPSLLVPILLLNPLRPPLPLLGGMVVLVAALSAALSIGFVALADSPGSVWIALVALATWCFARLDARPTDVPALLALITASLVTALLQASPLLALELPWLMTAGALQAVVCALIAHAVLPSRVAPPARRPPRVLPPGEAFSALVRGVALVAALGAAVVMQDTSAVLIAITAANILRAPPDEAEGQGRALLLANLGAAALLLPVLALTTMRPEAAVVMPLALAASLWIASGLGAGGLRGAFTQVGMSVFIILTGTLLPQAGEGSLAAVADRVGTLALTLAFALTVLALLHGRSGQRRPA